MFLREEPTEVVSEHLLDAITNDHDRRILSIAQSEPVEAQEIMDATGIARSTVYRRLSELVDHGLLEIAEAVLREGHRVDRYRSVCDLVEMSIRDATVEIRWVLAQTGEGDRHVLWPPQNG